MTNFLIQADDKFNLDDLESLSSSPQENISVAIRKLTLFVIDQLVNKKENLYDFVLFLGVNPNGSIQNAENIRSRIPHVLFFTRICCMYMKLMQDDNLPSHWLEFFESESPEGIISSLQMLMGYLQSVGDVSTLVSSIFWKRNKDGILDYREIVIDQTTVSLDQLKQGIQNAIQDANSLTQQLFDSYQVPEISLNYTDNVTNTEFGSSFESNDILSQYDEIVHDINWINRFTDNNTWNHTFCNIWIQKSDKLGACLLFLVHLTYGQPARATELARMQQTNSGQIQRSIFVLDQKVCLVQGYHKAQSLTGQERYIPRFLGTQLSKLLVIYLAFIKRWQQTLINLISPEERKVSLNQRIYLWTDRDGVLTAKKIRETILYHFIKYVKINLSVSMYRHVAIAFMEKHLKGYLIDIAFHLQAGIITA
jgi:hypothetical protein